MESVISICVEGDTEPFTISLIKSMAKKTKVVVVDKKPASNRVIAQNVLELSISGNKQMRRVAYAILVSSLHTPEVKARMQHTGFKC